MAEVSPKSILNRLKDLKVSAADPHSARALIFELEQLRLAGSAAFPAIREMLASEDDVVYDLGNNGGLRNGKLPKDFNVPPSLRLGLLEVVKNIGGAEAESILAETMRTTGRGAEVSYAAQTLQDLAPGQYRDAALTAARDLLKTPLTSAAVHPLDKQDRDYLYGVLTSLNDPTYAAAAQTQLIQPNGKVDQATLRYLKQTMGEQSVTVAVSAWDDPNIAAAQKEPFARLALPYVGVNADAGRIFEAAIANTNLTTSERRELIKDLGQDGFSSSKTPSAADVTLARTRLALLQRLSAGVTDPAMLTAFNLANRDLIKVTAPTPRPPGS